MSSIWNTMETAPRDGSWFLALRAVTLLASTRAQLAIPELQVLRRTSFHGEKPIDGGGYWQNSHGNSVADMYISGGLWAPLDALPLEALYLNRGRETPFPLSDSPEGERWIDGKTRVFNSILAQR